MAINQNIEICANSEAGIPITNNGKQGTDQIEGTKTKAVGKSAVKQIRYTATENEIIPAIGVQLKAVNCAHVLIGELVGKLVLEKGGVKYSEATIARIAVHPDINCSAQHLRRCWNLYRLHSSLWEMLREERAKVCTSSVYQLARLLDLDMDETALIAIIDDCIHKIVKRDLPVDDVREMVSHRLEEFGKLRKKSTAVKTKKTTQNEPKVDVVPGESDLFNFASGIAYMADPSKFSASRMAAAETRMGIIRLINEVVMISHRLIEAGPNHDLGEVLIKKADELREVGRQLLEPEFTDKKAA